MRRKIGYWKIKGRDIVLDNSGEFYGTYENAMKYYGIIKENSDIDIYNKKQMMMNIINYYQLDERTITRLSNELFYKLLKHSAEKRYYIEPELRIKTILEVLDDANDLGLIKDRFIKESLENSDKQRNQRRLYKQNKWEKDYEKSY